jgi:hypothetical protein
MELINEHVLHFINLPIRKDLSQEDDATYREWLNRWLQLRGLPLSSTDSFHIGQLTNMPGVFHMKNGIFHNFLIFLSKEYDLVKLTVTESKTTTFVCYETNLTAIRSFVSSENRDTLSEAILLSTSFIGEIKKLRTKIFGLKTWSTTFNSITFSFKNGSQFTVKLIFGELFFYEGKELVGNIDKFGSLSNFVEAMSILGGKVVMSDAAAADTLMSLSSN